MACQHVDLDGVGSEAQPLVPRRLLAAASAEPPGGTVRQPFFIRAATAGPTLRGNTTVETRLAQMMSGLRPLPAPYQDARRIRDSREADQATEYPASMKI
jgi:hypothetical protein